MAVQAHHMNIFSQLISSNRDCVKFQENMNHGEFDFTGGEVPLITGESFAVDPLAAKANFNKSESGLSYNFTVPPPSTKRPREFQFRDSNAPVKRRSVAFDSPPPSLINAELVSQIQNQQQSEIDRFVAHQTEKLRIEIEARQQTQTRMLASAVQNAIAKKLKEKDDEIVRIRNLNWVLQERVKSLYVETQIWRDIAQTNEANANTLRTNLDQVLAQIETFPTASAVVEDDVESSCGSCCGDGGGEAVTAVSGGCKRCGEREASVLVLPCRHLCLCTVCGGSALLRTCPVCDSVMNASVHVNMSS
ncbi:Zinc finger RING-type [Arabidopsis thaliana x Arabidopsis arenosa]|uniref:Zinc finger RING-type n=1 Tax=Arabidopsis thaliana x Arabidopsis arenosa TaxID=1240361 RepID=A0A8T1Y7I7_9BRAS|nr:Zinc finger RING-type [Arabidopsis thaliana x Arabidopsis arenosa]